ncbi:Heat shock 70 kDa protein 12B [Lachnellula occidentalis]|uniref:Heat shock 70 kDa protein 12B n=1 Tax=Lachnellula occidentalis TaxID=215460 RepID=A0A8H8RPW0_9HELO|nr:Heat shock 70 kDa protein 12B [Lachnellula occidentalis]
MSKPNMDDLEDMQGMTTAYESEDQLIVALDFGTTFSGIAYAFANGDKPEVVSIMDWPGLEGFKQPKIPTLISYDENGDFTWGGQKHKSDVVQGVKLLLDPDQPRPLYLPESTAKSDLKRLDKPPVKVVADFIGAMYQHSMSKIESAVPAQYLTMCQKQFVLTVPAVWSDKAKDTTLQAAKEAGLHPVTMIKEPEAAAMYTLHTLQDRALAVGDAFVICDAGGGTVDLISYEITQLKPTLELKELVPGKGGMAGSLGLNQRFEGAVKNLVGEDQYFHLRKSRGFSLAVEQFDRSVKTAFRNDPYEDYLINFPMAELKDDLGNNLKANCWNMTSDDVKAIFDPLIADIQRLVEEQVNLVKVKRLSESHPKATEIKAIFLVGGFGSSEYLKSQLEQDHSTIQIIQPHGAWAAIVKGAVLSQLPEETNIVSSQATRHYGVSARHVFDPRTDQGQPQHHDKVTGEKRVLTMTWYIHRGDDLMREHSITFPFFRTLAEGFTNDKLIFRDELIQSERKIAPRHPSPLANKVNCVLTADLSEVDRSHFKKVVGIDGRNYVQVFYDLVVTMKPAVMKFSLEIKGKEMGSVSAKF